MNDKPVSYVTALDLADMMQEYGESGFQYPFCMELKYVAVMLRQQQAKIEALKKQCLDEIFKRTYADRSAEVMCEYWQEAQAEIEALKLQLHTTLTNKDLRTYDGKTEINNEPLAYALRKEQEK